MSEQLGTVVFMENLMNGVNNEIDGIFKDYASSDSVNPFLNKDFILTCRDFIEIAATLSYLKEHEEHIYAVISSYFPDSYEKIEALYNAMCHDDCISVKNGAVSYEHG